MAKLRIFDSPINNPDDDLFGMVAYAEKLASFIETVVPPFTIGVYGEWGDGKTSFVKLLQRFLEGSIPKDKMKFISFSAWPHTTSDALWRALIIKIAKDLYGVTDSKPETQTQTPPVEAAATEGLWPAFANFLTSDAFVLRKPAPPADSLADYKKLIARLDRTAYGSISKSKEQQVQVNNDVALLSIVNAAIAALGTISPLVAGVRGLLGMESKVNLSELLHTEKNVATRDVIESIQEFKQVFGELFRDKAEGKRVFVFVDDLDRCLPDVALDILEAIKMFLDEVGCIFIVAADENLIGQGLRLRYSELFRSNDHLQMQTFFAQKGQEYFEKIIQFAVRVPAKTLEQAHTFISAQFPKWTSATDIIQTAIGNNPRRLKQYCNLLTYKNMVAQIQAKPGLDAISSKVVMDENKIQLLDKIITLYSWSEPCLRIMNKLTARPTKYVRAMIKIEELLLRSKEDEPLPEAETELADEDQYEFYKMAVASAPLFNLMRSSPRFSDESFSRMGVELPATYAQFADIKPHSGRTMLITRDAAFMRILAAVETQGSIAPDHLLREDLTKLIYFDHERPDILEKLHELSEDEDWMPQLISIEAALDPAASASVAEGVELNDAAKQLLEMLKAEDKSAPSSPINLFLEQPRFSAMLREEIPLYWRVRDKLPKAESLLAKELFESFSLIEKYRRIAGATLKLLPRRGREKVESCLRLRNEAAQYFLELRKSAKVDALIHKWPEVAQQRQINGPAFLKSLEAHIIEPETMAKGTPGNWQRYMDDEQLVRFMRLRPLFRDIFQDEFNKYSAASQAVIKTEPQKVAAEAAPPGIAPASYEEPEVFYDNLFLKINPVEGKKDQYHLLMETVDGKRFTSVITIPISETEAFAPRPVDLFQARGAAPITRETRVTHDDMAEHLREQGTQLYNLVFKDPEQRGTLLKSLREAKNLRIVLEFKDQRLMRFPWESLYVPELRTFPGLVKKCSLVRHFPNAVSLIPRTLTPPLKILAVVTNPQNAPLLNVEQEIVILERALAAAIQRGQVKLEIINKGTMETVQQALRVFQPHLFHFVGHGAYLTDVKEGVLFFEDDAGMIKPVGASVLKNLLVDSNISLAVLNACDTGSTGNDNVITGVAGVLVDNGIPAAIATMEAVLDSAALLFTREFYQSFTDGYTLEASVIEARKAISIEKWNWSTYALFSGTTELDSFKLVRSQVRKE